jgi:hypothetical protein
MNSENDDTNDTNNDILWFETEAAAFIGAPPPGSTAGLPARGVHRIRRSGSPSISLVLTPPRLLSASAICLFR